MAEKFLRRPRGEKEHSINKESSVNGELLLFHTKTKERYVHQ